MQDNQREELIYLAGLFDGEGTIGINSRYSQKYTNQNRYSDQGYAVFVRIGMNDADSIKRYYEFFQVGHYYPEKSYKNYRAMHRWDVRNQPDATMVLKQLEPFLRLKKPQAQFALKFIDECSRPRGVRIGIPFTPEMIQKRWEYYLHMKVLNGVDITDYSPAETKRMGRPKSIRVASDSPIS